MFFLIFAIKLLYFVTFFTNVEWKRIFIIYILPTLSVRTYNLQAISYARLLSQSPCKEHLTKDHDNVIQGMSHPNEDLTLGLPNQIPFFI